MDRRYLPNTRICVEDHGGDGNPVVLVHGLGGSAWNWGLVAPKLAESARVTALDLPGHGRSGPVDDHTLDAHTEAVITLVESFGWRSVTLIGSSMGGLISMFAATQRPDLVRSLVLLSPATPPTPSTRSIDPLTSARLVSRSLPTVGPFLTWLYLATRDPERQVAETLDLVMNSVDRLPPEMRERAVQLARLRRTMPWTNRAFSESAAAVRRLFLKSGAYRTLVDSVLQPTTLIYGDRDRVVPPHALRWLARHRSDWRTIELTGVGHTPMLERPDIVVHEALRRINVPEHPGGRGDSGEFGQYSPSARVANR